MAQPNAVENQQLNAGMHRRSSLKRQLWNYGVAIALVLIALLLMLAVDPYIQVKNTTFLIFHTALALAAWYGGRNVGILATVFSALLAHYFFVDPIFSLDLTFASGARLLIFVLQGILISVLVGALRRAQQQSKQSLKLQETAFYEQQAVLRELQQIEAALRDSEATFQGLVSNLPGMVYRYAPGADVFTYVSSGSHELTELAPAIILQDAGAFLALIHPDDLPSFQESVAIAVKNSAIWQWEGRIITRSGQLKWVQGRSQPQQTEDGEVWDGLLVDITEAQRSEAERKQAEEDRAEAEQRYRIVGDLIPFGIWEADLQGNATYLSPLFLEMTGTTLEEHRRVWPTLLHPDDTQPTVEAWYKCVRTGSLWEHEFRIRGADGHYRSILARGLPVRNAAGEITSYVGANYDMTDRKRAEVALQEKTAELQQITETAGVGLTRCNRDLRYLAVNSAYAEILGIPVEEIIGRPIVEVLGEAALETIRPYVERVLCGERVEYETEVPLATSAKRYFHIVYTPDEDSNGNIIGWVASITDITDRKQAEITLRDRENMLGGIVGSITDALVMFDNNWRYIFVNEEFLQRIGMSLTDVIGNNVWELFPDAVGNTAYTQLHQAMAERIPVAYEVFYEPYQRWYRDKAYPTPDGGLTVYSQDITDRKQAEQALQFSEERLQLAISSARLGMWFWDIEPDTLIWTERCKALFGLPLDDSAITYADFMAVLHPDDRQPTHEAVVRAIEERVNYDIEYRAVWQDGSVHWIAAKGSCVFDAAGKAVRMNGVVIDIDDRKQAEAILRQREAELREAQRLGKIGNWYWDAKTDVTTGSDELLRIYGFDPERDTMPNFADQDGWLYPHESWQRINQGVQQALETGVGYELDVQAFCNGTPIWITTRSEVLRDSDGTITGLRGTVLDITARKQAEEELRRQKEENEQLLQILPVAVWVAHDRLCQTITGNPFAEQLLSLPEDANASVTQPVEARNWIRHLHNGREMTTEELPLQRTIASGSGVKDIEFSLERVDGRLIHLLGNTAPLFDAEGRIRGAVAVCLDVTQWKQAAAALAENEARLRGFVEANVVGILYGDIYGNICEANDALLGIVGYTREDLHAGRLRWIDITPPEYLPLDERGIAEARERGACTPYEKEYIRKDGSRVPVLVGYSLVGSAREESVAFILDLTDRKQAEQERERLLQQEQILRQQAESAERRLYAILESIREDFVLLDRDWRVVYLNSQAATTMQKSRDEVLGRCFWDLFPDLVGTEFYDRLHQAMHEQTSIQFEYHYEIWDTWFENRVYPADEGIIVLCTNITDRVQFERDRERILQQEQAAREAAENANRVKDEFLAVLICNS